MPLVAGVAVVVLLIAVRHYAIRQVAAGHGRFVWLMFGQSFISGLALLWVATRMFAMAPVAAVVTTVAGCIYLLALVRFLTRLSRSVNGAGGQGEAGIAMTDLLLKYLLAWLGVVLIGGLALILWALSGGR
jgi:hypothetical protein